MSARTASILTPHTRLAALMGALACVVVALGFPAPAWALYKVTQANGKVIYSDRSSGSQIDTPEVFTPSYQVALAEPLPYELQKTVARYPVTLYTGANCVPCDAGRQLLKSRGVPFTEKTVSTADDARALIKIENTENLPVLRMGQKQLQGFAHADWTAYLDAAAYPAKSALPASYRWPVPSPLAPTPAVNREAPPGGETRAPTVTPSVEAPKPAIGAPPGFRF